jgi:hypothetical protein
MSFEQATHWRTRAEEARTFADQFPDAISKRLMRKMAADYEQLANLADERHAARAKRSTRAQSKAQADASPMNK